MKIIIKKEITSHSSSKPDKLWDIKSKKYHKKGEFTSHNPSKPDKPWDIKSQNLIYELIKTLKNVKIDTAKTEDIKRYIKYAIISSQASDKFRFSQSPFGNIKNGFDDKNRQIIDIMAICVQVYWNVTWCCIVANMAQVFSYSITKASASFTNVNGWTFGTQNGIDDRLRYAIEGTIQIDATIKTC